MRILKVTTLPPYKINVSFDDGVAGVINLESLTKKGIFKILKDPELFKKVYTTGYSIGWSEELEIDAMAIYAEITGKNPQEIPVSSSYHAAD
jgi:hypothetical protein